MLGIFFIIVIQIRSTNGYFGNLFFLSFKFFFFKWVGNFEICHILIKYMCPEIVILGHTYNIFTHRLLFLCNIFLNITDAFGKCLLHLPLIKPLHAVIMLMQNCV